MRKIILPVALALVVGTSGLAFAATTAPVAKVVAAAPAATMVSVKSLTDTIKSFNLHSHTLTLANGVSYKLPTTFKDPGLKVGSKVTVKWEMKGKSYQADSVTLG